MAMNLDTAIKFTAKLEGQGLDQLKRNLQGLSQQSNVSKRSLDQLYTATQKLGAASGNTISGLQKTVGALKALRDNAEVGSRSFKLLTRDIEAAEARLRKFQGTASGSGGVSRGGALLAGVAGGVAGSIATMAAGAGANAIRGIGQVGLDAESARVRLRALSNEFGEYNAAQQAAARIAQTLRISTTEAEQSFSSLYASLRPTGITIQELEKAFIGFSAAARNSGATAAETQGALLQLKQGLASGTLMGEDLQSIRENAPLAAQAIAKEMGVTIGEIKQLGSEGKITTDIVLRALGRLNDTQLGKLNEQFDTGQQALKDFRVASEEVGKTIARIFGPTAISILRGFTNALKEANDVLGGITGDGAAGRRAQLRVQANQQAARETNAKFGIFAPFQQGSKQDFLLKREQEIYQQLLQQDQQRQQQDKANADQLAARQAAAGERAAAQARAAAEADKERLKAAEKEAEIRLDTERKLADFREQALQRAKDLERSLGDQRLELERSTAEARRRIAAQQQDFALERERLQLRSQGLGTEALDTQARLNEATRRYAEQKIAIEQNATDKKVQLERTLEEYKLSVARGISEILQDAGRKLADNMQKGAKGAAATLAGATTGAAMGGTTAGRYIQGGIGPSGPNTYGPHFDIKRSDGGFYPRNALDPYVRVNGQPLSSGTTVPGGRYGAPRSYGPHAGWDYAFGPGAALSLTGGAKWMGSRRGANGDETAFMTPDGKVYKIIHGRFEGAVGSSRQLIGRNAASATSIPATPGVDAAGRKLTAAQGANTAALGEANLGDLVKSRQQEFAGLTEQLDQQRASVFQQRQDFERILELQRSGLSPELAKQVVDRERQTQSMTQGLVALERQLVLDLQSKDLTGESRKNVEKLLQDTRNRIFAQAGVNEGLTTEERLLEQVQRRQQQIKDLSQSLAQTIGGGLSEALNVLITGTENWGNSLRKIASQVLTQIANKLLEITLIQPFTKSLEKGLGGLFSSLFPMPGASLVSNASGGLAAALASPFALGGIMTANGPVPLRSYARGGVANSPQLAMFGEGSMPEAYVPLPDGRRIPVKMQGSGNATNVVVNVDASGGTQVQGNPGQADALGRAVSQAVQAELIRQKRPGGLLAA